MYESVFGDTQDSFVKPLTFRDILTLCQEYPNHSFYLLGTDHCVSEVCSWRGSYDLPAMKYSRGLLTGVELEKIINDGLNQTHWGYKGGEYRYDEDESPYLVSCSSSSEEYKIAGWKDDSNVENTICLLTRKYPY